MWDLVVAKLAEEMKAGGREGQHLSNPADRTLP
jgi:hypothetical protein